MSSPPGDVSHESGQQCRPDQHIRVRRIPGGNGQTLILDIASYIKGGTVDLFLFAPDGTERRITIGSGNTTEEVALEKGTWQYNCSGLFKDGGNVRIVGTVR